ncbi:MAG TPA: hypothetical protein VF457_01355, partial [Burkholderiaceae bacterium]
MELVIGLLGALLGYGMGDLPGAIGFGLLALVGSAIGRAILDARRRADTRTRVDAATAALDAMRQRMVKLESELHAVKRELQALTAREGPAADPRGRQAGPASAPARADISGAAMRVVPVAPVVLVAPAVPAAPVVPAAPMVHAAPVA